MKHNQNKQPQTHTRRISPKLGLLGVLGILGLLGFVPRLLAATDSLPVPSFFLFFCFFGFFGFYYEGKMAGTLMDERFQANNHRACAIANKLALIAIIAVTIIATSFLRIAAYAMLSLLLATIGLAFGLAVFLQQYLLYKFENEA